MLEGIGFYCGLTMRWFRDAFCQEEKEEAKRLASMRTTDGKGSKLRFLQVAAAYQESSLI